MRKQSAVLLIATWLGMLGVAWGQPAKAPNLQVTLRQRTFPAGEKLPLELSTYNMKQATLALYPVQLSTLAPNAFAASQSDAKTRGSLPDLLARLNLRELRAVRRWTVTVKDPAANSWEETEVQMSPLPAGVYVLQATGGQVEKRTWLAVSTRALLVKRSPSEILAWVVNAKTGQPVVGLPVALFDEEGKAATLRTTGEGLVKFAPLPIGKAAWVTTAAGDPAFALASSPYKLDPYEAYVYTDRPVYRPGHLVHFRGTVREVLENGYQQITGNVETVQVQIKTRGGSTGLRRAAAAERVGQLLGGVPACPRAAVGRLRDRDHRGHGTEAEPLLHALRRRGLPQARVHRGCDHPQRALPGRGDDPGDHLGQLLLRQPRGRGQGRVHGAVRAGL